MQQQIQFDLFRLRLIFERNKREKLKKTYEDKFQLTEESLMDPLE